MLEQENMGSGLLVILEKLVMKEIVHHRVIAELSNPTLINYLID